jgi:hypothetical protein
MATSEIIMIRPCSFSFNEDTADSNHFQNISTTQESIQDKALAEFNNMVDTLQNEGVKVTVFDDNPEPHTPDSIFPNNWFTTHADGTICLFPMEAPNRRLERREDLIQFLETSYRCQRIVDLTDAERIDVFLEGTGSIVFDHDNRLAFACKSSRTNEQLLSDFCETIGYSPVVFEAKDGNNNPIYHTNVMMNIGKDYVVICMESIPERQRSALDEVLCKTEKRIIAITLEQANSFAGNMLELQGKEGRITVLSQTTFNSLTIEQKADLSVSSKLVPIDINTIENTGGGSVRCMMAEIFLPHL